MVVPMKLAATTCRTDWLRPCGSVIAIAHPPSCETTGGERLLKVRLQPKTA
jgi:hypothetical protein